MTQYKIAFVGLGSIATLHLKNLNYYLNSRGDRYTLDIYRSFTGKPLPEDVKSFVSNTYIYSDVLPSTRHYDIVFVTNPTSMHLETVLKFANHANAFFIEKPLSDQIEIDDSFFKTIEGITCYVACPLRYNPVLQYLKANVKSEKVLCARAISSSYLPEWRPNVDYRNCYSAHKAMGGGVSIDLIHEWDYLTWLLGMPTDSRQFIQKISPLDIDSDDIAVYIGRNNKTFFELHLDYFGRKTIRTLDLFISEETIHCDLIEGTVNYLKCGDVLKFDNKRNLCHLREIEHFFEILTNKDINDSTPEHAYRVLKIAKGVF